MKLLLSLILLIVPSLLFPNEDLEKLSISKPEHLLNNPYSLANFESPPITLVHNCVNVLTGDYIDSSVDMVLEGSEPIHLKRYYCSSIKKGGSLYGGWNHNLWGLAIREKTNRHHLAVTKGGQGGEYLYKAARGKALYIHPDILRKGVTNCATGKMSAKTNVKNNILNFADNRAELKTGDGKAHLYNRSSSGRYLLKKVIKPNGFRHRYHYHDKKETLARFYIQNNVGQVTNYLDMTPLQKDNSRNSTLIATTSDKRQVVYTYSNGKDFPPLLTSVEATNTPKETFFYETVKGWPRITKKWLPDKRYLHISYTKSGKEAKVDSLIAPAGKNGQEVPIYRFEYKKEGNTGQTFVYDACNFLTKYTYSLENYRLSSIERQQPSILEKFYWGGENTVNEAQLISHTLQDGERICLCRHYQYDGKGNVIRSLLAGNLCGKNESSVRMNQESPDLNSCEFSVKRSVYSKDDLNLLIESEEYGVITKYSYHPGTNLLEAKYTIYDGLIQLREFFLYEEDLAAVKLHILDNGTGYGWNNLEGVTERKIRKISNTRYAPFGLPEVIEEYGTDPHNSQVEIFISRTVNHYNGWGRLVQKDVYDDSQAFAYSLFWEYNDYGNVIKETDAIGQTISRRFDSNGNKVYEQGPRPTFYQEFAYDQMNRLVQTKKFEGGKVYETFNAYDPKGNRITATDISGNETQFEYDALGRIVKETLPPALDENKKIYYPEKKYTYDLFGNVTSYTDPKGQTEKAKYTIKGKPYFKQYPDGSKERFEYSLRGELTLKVNKDGSYTTYKYDYDSRPIEILFYNNQGQLLKSTVKEYNAFHLIKEKSSDGQVVIYSYDYAGRLSETFQNNKRTTYSYDALGREKEKRIYYNPHDYVSYQKEYDLLDRVVAEREQDSAGNIFKKIEYAYDGDNNLIKIKTFNQAGESVLQKDFDSFNHLIRRIDGEGHITEITHDHHFCNQYGVSVLYKVTKDPLGNCCEEIYDAIGRTELIRKKDKEGKTTQQEEYCYDRAGNRCRLVERVITPEKPDKEILTIWTYDCMNRMIESAEAVAQPEDRVIRYAYDQMGNVIKVIKPDGVEIFKNYDALGNLIEKYSSDHSFHYKYVYNGKNQLTQVIDLKGQKSNFVYDENLHLIEETLSNDLTLTYAYDFLGRVTKIVYPDASFSCYYYEGPYLKRISRHDPLGHKLYEHAYSAYDLSGNVISSQLPGNCGTLQHEYTRLNQLKKITSKAWEEKILSYDAVGNVLEKQMGNLCCKYSYDDLYQLTSETGIANNHYVYDSRYNPVKTNDQERVYNDLSQLKSDGEKSFTYDRNGNLINDGTGQFSYDALDRLTGYESEKFKVEYTYDFCDRRIKKRKFTKAGLLDEEVDYLYVGQQEIGAVQKQQLIELRVLGHGKGLESAISVELDGKPYVPLHDHQGNCTTLLDLDGEVIESCQYSAFGQSHEENNNPWQYAAKRYDQETGLVYFGKRYYSPRLMRWLTPDPAGFVDGMNLYAYLRNNPYRYVDPDGCMPFAIPLFCLAWGAGEAVVITVTAEHALIAALSVATYLATRYGLEYLDFTLNQNTLQQEGEETEEDKKKKRNCPPPPDTEAEGNPHTIIEKPGQDGQYTTHNGDGTLKQYRGSGKSHGNIPRPNIKENEINNSPDGPRPGKLRVREPTPDEIPQNK